MSSPDQAVTRDCSLTTQDSDEPAKEPDCVVEHAGAAETRPNPYCFPQRHLSDGRMYNGFSVHQFLLTEDPIEQVKKIRKMLMRSDDILLATYPKSGTHWVSEILHMLMRGSTDYSTQTKEFNMLEFMDDLAKLDHMTSPRLLNSHLYIAHLPEQMIERKVKIVHVIRNPKDLAVSYFYQMKQHAPEGFTFNNFIKGYTTEGYTKRSHQLSYLRQMSQFEKENPDYPVLHVHYEDLKRDPVSIIQELSNFIGVQTSRKFCHDVASACGFDQMKQADVKRDLPTHIYKTFHGGFSIYRKGMVGDWKNTFTVSQNEMFDQFLARQEEKGQPYTFRWS